MLMMGEAGADPTAKRLGTPASIRKGLVSRAKVTAAVTVTFAEAEANAAATAVVLTMVSAAAARSSESG